MNVIIDNKQYECSDFQIEMERNIESTSIDFSGKIHGSIKGLLLKINSIPNVFDMEFKGKQKSISLRGCIVTDIWVNDMNTSCDIRFIASRFERTKEEKKEELVLTELKSEI